MSRNLEGEENTEGGGRGQEVGEGGTESQDNSSFVFDCGNCRAKKGRALMVLG